MHGHITQRVNSRPFRGLAGFEPDRKNVRYLTPPRAHRHLAGPEVSKSTKEDHMHRHDVERTESSLRPKPARLDPEPDSRLFDAAATGRRDALGPQALLGLQRAVGNAGTAGLMQEERSPVLDVVGSGGGSPLAPDVRADMESRLGHDFGDVRVHSDSAAHDSAKAVNAHAYTVGSNVVFQRDAYDPSSTAGKTMLAHELTHVVQQRAGAVDGTATGGGIRVSDPSDRFEREASANAERVMSAPTAATPVTPSGAAVQREAAPEEEKQEDVQTYVQREDAPAEEEEAVQGAFVQRADEEEAGEA